jgi:DNA-binding SARP family transcriptional activator
MELEFRVLGQVTVRDGSEPTAPKVRVFLAMLLCQANHHVAGTDLVDELWGGRVPRSAAANLRTYAATLRRAFARYRLASQLLHGDEGYRLLVTPEHVDLFRFRQLTGTARDAASRGDLALAVARFGQAADLWRGAPLAGVRPGPVLAAWRAALDEERGTALEEQAAALLRLGRAVEAIALLRQACVAYPLREPLVGQLMLAYQRTGRTSDALLAFRHLRGTLIEELGIEPCATLQRLHRRILTGDRPVQAH